MLPRVYRLHRASVLTCVRNTEADFATRLANIYKLDEQCMAWWHNLKSDFKLTRSNMSTVQEDLFPRVLLINMLFYQSICSLHASIVPLFCCGTGDGNWLCAQQLSAQKSYEHACTASELLEGVLEHNNRLSALPSFVSYTAYSGCAIHIPFMWSSNPVVKQRAHANVRTNLKVIDASAVYWKYSALLVPHS